MASSDKVIAVSGSEMSSQIMAGEPRVPKPPTERREAPPTPPARPRVPPPIPPRRNSEMNLLAKNKKENLKRHESAAELKTAAVKRDAPLKPLTEGAADEPNAAEDNDLGGGETSPHLSEKSSGGEENKKVFAEVGEKVSLPTASDRSGERSGIVGSGLAGGKSEKEQTEANNETAKDRDAHKSTLGGEDSNKTTDPTSGERSPPQRPPPTATSPTAAPSLRSKSDNPCSGDKEDDDDAAQSRVSASRTKSGTKKQSNAVSSDEEEENDEEKVSGASDAGSGSEERVPLLAKDAGKGPSSPPSLARKDSLPKTETRNEGDIARSSKHSSSASLSSLLERRNSRKRSNVPSSEGSSNLCMPIV